MCGFVTIISKDNIGKDNSKIFKKLVGINKHRGPDKSCELLTPDGYKIYWDPIHITEEGAKYLGKKIKKLDWFKSN